MIFVMPPFFRGRLFWKIFVFFFLAQLAGIVVTGVAIWATLPDASPGFTPPPRGFFELPPRPPSGRDGGPSRPPHPPPGPRFPLKHLLAGTAASLVFSALLAAYIARPVRRLRAALQAGASGEMVTDLAASMGGRCDELTDLCRDFDRMAQHIDQLMRGQRRLMHDVSHEMRSPLARLSAIMGLMRQQPERIDDCLDLLERESERMDRLVSELLTLSRLESGVAARRDELVDLAEILADAVTDAGPEAEQAACAIEIHAGGNFPMRGDGEMLHRLFDNLLRNALAYASCGGWIGIRAERIGKTVCVCVEDRGPGVLDADLERLFEPFFRGHRTPSRNGHGLGLAIARQIVMSHSGRIAAENRHEGGLRVKIEFPLADVPSSVNAIKASG